MTTKQAIRRSLTMLSPALAGRVHAFRHRRYLRRKFEAFHRELRPYLFPASDPHVLSGPFLGMRYLDEIVWSSIVPKWLGSYESELQPVLAEIANRSYSAVIDIGCAEGYYAVGLARMLASARVYAFDTDFISRGQTARLASLNNASARVTVRGFCHPADLAALCANNLVVCDIEGAETELLDPILVANLKSADILVELHDENFQNPVIETTLRQRFQSTHAILKIAPVDRSAWRDQHPHLIAGIPNHLQSAATDEHRGIKDQAWLWMTAE